MAWRTYPTGSGTVHLDPVGTVVGFTSLTWPDASCLERAGTVRVLVDGAAVVWSTPTVSFDVDEVEVTTESDLGLRVVVRHTFDPVWTVRLRLSNRAGDALVLGDVTVDWQASPGWVVTAAGAGSVAQHAVAPADGRGPILVGRLSAGNQVDADEDGLRLGPVTLPPGASHVVQWRWELAATPRQAVRPAPLPPTTWFDLAETVTLPAGPDVAVVAPQLTLETTGASVELAATDPGAYAVELRSARGTVRLGLDWAPELSVLVDAAAAHALDAPRSRAGVPRLDGVGTGLAVLDGLARLRVAEPDRAGEALEVLAAGLAERRQLEPLALALLVQELERQADDVGLARVEGLVLDTSAPVPGLGLAATRLCLALLRTGRGVAAVTEHLADLAAVPSRQDDLRSAAARLELRLLTGARGAQSDLSANVRSRSGPFEELLRVGAALGAGLPGRRTSPLPVATAAYLSAVLVLVPEEIGQELRAWWGIGASELARRAAAQSRARLARGGSGADLEAGAEALGWLLLGAPLA